MRFETLIAGFTAIAVGTAIGAASFTFFYAEGAAYLTDDPKACGNCHVMQEQLVGWEHSSHRAVAVCNDCHAPRAFLEKYTVKAVNGWNHSVAFTLDNFHEPIRMTPMNRAVTEKACRECHRGISGTVEAASKEPVDCLRCHPRVGHL